MLQGSQSHAQSKATRAVVTSRSPARERACTVKARRQWGAMGSTSVAPSWNCVADCSKREGPLRCHWLAEDTVCASLKVNCNTGCAKGGCSREFTAAVLGCNNCRVSTSDGNDDEGLLRLHSAEVQRMWALPCSECSQFPRELTWWLVHTSWRVAVTCSSGSRAGPGSGSFSL